MEILKVLTAAVAAYLIGSVSSAVVVSFALSRTDVRNYGSGNAGATNMARVFGMGIGVLTLLLDFLKTVLAMWLGRLIDGRIGLLVAGLTCLLGHCYPIYFKFKGGKGISIGAAIGLMLDWKMLVALLVVFALGFILTRRISAGSVAAALLYIPLELLCGINDPGALILGACCTLIATFTHRENIKRLLRGEEKEFKPGKRWEGSKKKDD